MRHFKLYFSLLMLGILGLVSCEGTFDQPPVVVPVATHTANTTILDLKTKYWNDAKNYIDTIGLTSAGDSMVIHGRVISSDATGNIYKSLVIQDETGAMAISINGTSLYSTYRVGQEIVIPVTGLFIGKYNSLQQLGYPEYTAQFGWEATFLPLAMFQAKAELNGMPEVSSLDTITTTIASLPTTPDGIRKMQSQLVRLDNVKFSEANGTITYSEPTATTNRTLQDESGNTIIVRNSNYATFKSDILPSGTGSVVGILSYYGTAWQILLRSTEDCIGFNGTDEGSEKNPYTMDKAIELQNSGKSGWVTGYIVGAVAPEVSAVKSNSDIEWKAPTTLANTLVIGASADTKDIKNCIVMELPQNSALRTAANLKDNAKLLGTQIWVKGKLATYMGTYGLTGNGGTSSEYKLAAATGGVTSLKQDFTGVTDFAAAGWGNVQVAGDKDWFLKTFSGNTYASVTGYKGTAPFDSWLISPAIDLDNSPTKKLSFKSEVNGYGSKTSTMEVYLLSNADPKIATKTKLNATFATAPASGYSEWVSSGVIDLSKYTGTVYIAFRYAATADDNYATWCIDDIVYGEQGSTPSPSAVDQTRGDFETFNTSAATAYYGTYTTTSGWTAANSNILSGGTSDSNPVFQFIGYATGSTSQFAFAPCLRGKVGAEGSLISPTISTGCGTLSFNYGMPYTESNGLSFRVDIKQNGSVVKTFTVTDAAAAKLTAYAHSEEINVSGNFSIEFHALSPSNVSDSNKDRVAIWNVTWTKH
jgi:hypothetical protein